MFHILNYLGDKVALIEQNTSVLEARQAAPSKCKVLDAEAEDSTRDFSASFPELEVVQNDNLVVIF
jgi:hypothetical protein